MPDEMNQQPQQVPLEQFPQQVQQPPIQQPGVVVQQPVQSKGTSGMGIASLVLGILAILTSFLPIINNGSFFLALLGIILAIVGIIVTKKGKKSGRGLAIAGLILNILSIIIVLATQSLYGAAIDSALESTGKATASNTATNTPPSTSSEQGSNAAQQEQQAQQEQAPSSAQETETASQAAYTVNIEGVRLGQDYEGKDIAIVTYSWENNSEEADAFWLVFYPKVFQNNVEVETAFTTDIDNDGYMAEVKPGGGTTFEIAYEIKDYSDITVEVSPLFDWNDEVIAEQTFALS